MKIDNEKAKEILAQIDNKLYLIDVSGDSVEHLFIARRLLKELFNAYKETPNEKGKEG